jgi:hypothetical protein
MMAMSGCAADTEPAEVADLAESEVHSTSIEKVRLFATFTNSINKHISHFGELRDIQPTVSRGEDGGLTIRGTAALDHEQVFQLRLPGEADRAEEHFRDELTLPIRVGDTGATVAARVAAWARSRGFRVRLSRRDGGTHVNVEAAVRVANVRIVEGASDPEITVPDLVLEEFGPGAFGWHFWRNTVQSARTIGLDIDGMIVRIPVRKGAGSLTVLSSLLTTLNELYERTGHYVTHRFLKSPSPTMFTIRQRLPLR